MSAALRLEPLPRSALLGVVSALAASLGVHALLLLLGGWAAQSPPLAAPTKAPSQDVWVGNSIEVSAPSLAEPAPAVEAETPDPPGPARPPPRRARREPAAAAATPASAAPATAVARSLSEPASADPTATPASPGSFGSEGLPPGVRRLGYAFTRAIPAAAPGDAAWRELPTGPVGTIRVEFQVDAAGRIGDARPWKARADEPDAPPVLERMVARAVLLLRAGQFALSRPSTETGSTETVGAGTERLVVEVRLSDAEAEANPSQAVVQQKFEGASLGHPGTAYFRYGSGRTFQATVTIVPTTPAAARD